MKKYDKIVNDISEITFFPELKQSVMYRIASNNFVSDNDYVTEIFRRQLKKR